MAGAILVVLISSFLDALAAQAGDLEWSWSSLRFSLGCLAPIIAVTAAGMAFILRRDDDRSLTRIAATIVAVSFFCRLAWISGFDSYQVNDFGYYLNCGMDVASSGKPWESRFCGPDNGLVYWQRSAFYTYPIALLFGKSLLAIKLVNVLLATLTAWIFFLAGKQILGAKTSAIGLLLFIWHPDLWYAMTLASHDFPGLFWLSVFFYTCVLLQRRLSGPDESRLILPLLSLCLGVSLFFLAATRSYHYGALLALVTYSIVHACLILTSGEVKTNEVTLSVPCRYNRQATRGERLRNAAVHTILLLVIPVLTYMAATSAFRRSFGPLAGSGDAGLPCYLSSIDVLGQGRYEEIDNWMTECPEVTSAERRAFAVRKVLHEVTHDPREFLRYLVRKSRTLCRGDDYLGWSTAEEPETWDTTRGQVKRVNNARLEEQSMMVFFAHGAVLLLVAWRLILYPALPFRLLETIPLLFSSLYYSMFLFLLETQSRYDIFLVFVFSWMAAQAILDLMERVGGKTSRKRVARVSSHLSAYAGGACLLAVLLCLFLGVSPMVADSYLTLRDQSGFEPAPRNEVVPSAMESPLISPVFVRNNYRQLMVAYPPGISLEAGSIMAVQRTFTIRPRARHHLRFFISTYAVRTEPFDAQMSWQDTSIGYVVAVNGKPIAAGDLATTDIRYCSFYPHSGLRFSPSMTIQLLLKNNARIERVGPDRGPLVSLEYIDLQ